jgi:hypothetical protein
MARQTRYGWRWLVVLFGGLAWLSIGCSPQSLTMFLLPFDGANKQEPEYKLFPDKKFYAEGKEIKLVVLSNFANAQFQPDIRPADHELADAVSEHLRLRCQANKQKLKLVPQAEVQSYQMKGIDDGDITPLDIGKKFKADYVLDLTIQKFSLYQEKSYPRMFCGNTQIGIKLYKMDTKGEEPVVFTKAYANRFTNTHGDALLEAGNSDPTDFRRAFMSKLGKEISRMFIPYDQDETKQSAPWD